MIHLPLVVLVLDHELAEDGEEFSSVFFGVVVTDVESCLEPVEVVVHSKLALSGSRETGNGVVFRCFSLTSGVSVDVVELVEVIV